ncbi:MAG: hypothetical protein J4A00_04140 [Gammaproteobacteria bacterium]|nr:hypothetical protein [Gammaproteobacteria bacterium]
MNFGRLLNLGLILLLVLAAQPCVTAAVADQDAAGRHCPACPEHESEQQTPDCDTLSSESLCRHQLLTGGDGVIGGESIRALSLHDHVLPTSAAPWLGLRAARFVRISPPDYPDLLADPPLHLRHRVFLI